ncbi:MAG: tetratricopeptide repeat protein [Oligoflexia bacterium]|nr:tetratricopeptide repeat protein [Oligoflexia bacterium]
MHTRVVVIWSSMLLTLWVGVFGFFNHYFSGVEFERARVAKLTNQVQAGERDLARLALKFSEFQDAMVAAGLRIDETTTFQEPRRLLASVVAEPRLKKILLPERGEALLIKGRNMFLAGDYVRASEILEDFVEKYPGHPQLPVGAYLLQESYYLSDHKERAVHMIDYVISHFPETELSAYSLLRLGNIFERESRVEEAAEIYETIRTNFPNTKAKAMASGRIRELDL